MDFESGSCRRCYGFPCPEEHAPEPGFSKGGEKNGGLGFSSPLWWGRTGGTAPSFLPHSLLPLPSFLILSVLPLQIPKGSQLLGQAGDAAFPGRKISGADWDGHGKGCRSPRQVCRARASRGEEGWRKTLGRRGEGRGGWGGRMAANGRGTETWGRAPRSIAPPNLGWLLPQLQLCPSCWKWNEARSSPCRGPMSARS